MMYKVSDDALSVQSVNAGLGADKQICFGRNGSEGRGKLRDVT